MKVTLRLILCFLPLTSICLTETAWSQAGCAGSPMGDPQVLRGSIRNGTAMGGDPFLCGTGAAPTPATCFLYNRVYTDQESICINQERGENLPDYLPVVFGTSLQRYESDVISVGNWPSDLGDVDPVPKNWFLLWDSIVNSGSSNYIGYYAAQSDLVANGELGNHRLDPCTGGSTALSCMTVVKNSLADDCNPVNTPLGTLLNLGALAAVPVPLLKVLLADSDLGFTDPDARIALEWIPACNWTQNIDSAGGGGLGPIPVMGYRVEVFVDRNANGMIDQPTSSGWDPALRADVGGCQSGSFVPLLDIAPSPADVIGTHLTSQVAFELAPFAGAGGILEDPATIESLTFRLRILFYDDRFAAVPGGKDTFIDPVCSAPSAMGFAVENPSVFGAPAGAIPDGDGIPGVPLDITQELNGDVTLVWDTTCNVGDNDYVVYEGVLGDFNSHEPRFCSTGGATSVTFTPNTDNAYFLVAPRNAQFLGSFGKRGDVSDRPVGPMPCVPQDFACSGSAAAPVATTDPATAIADDAATLNGTVDPQGFGTTARFEWGPDMSMGNVTADIAVGEGTGAVPVSSDLTGLSADTTYYFRIVAESGVGTTTGATESFLTPSAP